MAITAVLSQKEMERVAGLAYEGQAIRVSLAYDPGDTLSSEDTVATWDASKVSGGGYADFNDTIGTGAYDVADQRYEMPQVEAVFTATGAGYTFNKVYVVIGSELYLHSLTTEDPAIIMAAGQTQTYRIILATDD